MGVSAEIKSFQVLWIKWHFLKESQLLLNHCILADLAGYYQIYERKESLTINLALLITTFQEVGPIGIESIYISAPRVELQEVQDVSALFFFFAF